MNAKLKDAPRVEFRSKIGSLIHVIRPPQIGPNLRDKGLVVVFMNGYYATRDPEIIDNLRDAIERQPVATDGHGLKGLVWEVDEEFPDVEEFKALAEEIPIPAEVRKRPVYRDDGGKE